MKLNPQMVTLARELRELTQEQLADRVGVGQAKIAKVEGGLQSDVADEIAERLASALEMPLEFLQQSGDLVGVGSSAYFYRKKADLSARDRKRIHALINLLRLNLGKMLNSIEIEARRPLPQLDVEDYGGSPERVAQAIRQLWNLPDGPIVNLTTLIESAGVVIIPVDFGTQSMDGTSIRLADMPPLIFINIDLPGDRWRFTLAHELGHLIMHDVPHEQMEDEADAFAAELLMPTGELRPIFKRLTTIRLEDLAKLKPFWRTSMAALLKRAGDLGFLSANARKNLWITYRRTCLPEPSAFEQEPVRTYSGITQYFVDSLDYTRAEMESLLHISGSDFERLYRFSSGKPKTGPTLRVV
ncbi:XRE family transcriptional regulator [Paraburkholderia kururiensis]|uniref:XRE family transcriptional regulator n=1 Tax=Paraburkholderia kururiensis TaxID=984307 RepID=UPI0014706C96|nr:XRE family transcriptional regulator [Paraburkholderia kururiensis]